MYGPLMHRRLPSSAFWLCRRRFPQRSFTTTTAVWQADSKSSAGEGATQEDKDMKALALTKIFGRAQVTSPSDTGAVDDILKRLEGDYQPHKIHHLHVMATKHNTHITLTTPARNPIISISSGGIGFRKAARGTYDASYQLAAYVLGQISERGLLAEMERLEVVLRGFGIGREAVTKAILGQEGRRIRHMISQVTDSTRLKFGGTRSKKPRRLG